MRRFEVGDAVRLLYADGAGWVWGATGIVRLAPSSGQIRRYGTESGFTDDLDRLSLSFADGRPLASMLDSVRVYDRFGARPDWFGPLKVSSIRHSDDGTIWIFGGPTEKEQVLLRYPNRGAEPDTVLTRLGYSFTGEIYHSDHDALWVTTPRGLYRAIPPCPSYPLLSALVHEIARLHGSKVNVESEAGDGSTFTLLLPADPLPSDGLTRGPAGTS